jgi:hypothetical protein
MMWRVPPTALLSERAHRLGIKAESMSRLARGWLNAAGVDVLGAYNTSNVGDRSFATCLGRAAESLGLRPQLQDYSRYRSSRHATRLVIGGGGVIGPQNDALRACAEHRSRVGGAISVVGVAGGLHPDDVAPVVRELLRRAAFVSVRDHRSGAALEQLLGRSVEVQPDIAFSLLDWFPSLGRVRARTGPLTVGLSVSPVLASRSGLDYAPNARPSNWFAARIPDVAAVYTQVAPAYVRLIRACVRRYLDRGFRVVVIPFAAEDATFAHTVLASSGAVLEAFDPSPLRVFERVASCNHFVATRFHAHVFALLARVPLLSLAYSEKCSLLLNELLGWDPSIDRIAWVTDAERCLSYLDDLGAAVTLTDSQWANARSLATQATVRGLSAII